MEGNFLKAGKGNACLSWAFIGVLWATEMELDNGFGERGVRGVIPE